MLSIQFRGFRLLRSGCRSPRDRNHWRPASVRVWNCVSAPRPASYQCGGDFLLQFSQGLLRSDG